MLLDLNRGLHLPLRNITVFPCLFLLENPVLELSKMICLEPSWFPNLPKGYLCVTDEFIQRCFAHEEHKKHFKLLRCIGIG